MCPERTQHNHLSIIICGESSVFGYEPVKEPTVFKTKEEVSFQEGNQDGGFSLTYKVMQSEFDLENLD